MNEKIINEARGVIITAKSNIKEMQQVLKHKNKLDSHSVMTFRDLIAGDKELINCMNELIKERTK